MYGNEVGDNEELDQRQIRAKEKLMITLDFLNLPLTPDSDEDMIEDCDEFHSATQGASVRERYLTSLEGKCVHGTRCDQQ